MNGMGTCPRSNTEQLLTNSGYTDTNVFAGAIANGINAGAQWLEIYKEDVAAYGADVATAHQTLIAKS
jgi:hypothetical protein